MTKDIIQGCPENFRKRHGITTVNVIDNVLDCIVKVGFVVEKRLESVRSVNQFFLHGILPISLFGNQSVLSPRSCRFIRTIFNSVSISSNGTLFFQIMAYHLCWIIVICTIGDTFWWNFTKTEQLPSFHNMTKMYSVKWQPACLSLSKLM